MIGLGAEKLRETPPSEGAAIGAGVALDRDPEAKPAPIIVPDTDREGHIFTMGATRSGKTRLAEAMIEHDIRAGRSILWIDPKGDNAIFSKIVTVAREAGREDDLLFFSPVFPRYSVRIDPLSHYFMPEEVVNHVVSGVRVRDEFYFNIAYEVTLVVVQSLMLISKSMGERPVFTWGYPVRILSTHNSKSSLFYKFLEDVKAGKRDWYYQKTDIYQAVAEGLVDRIYGRRTTAAEQKAWLEQEQRDCANEEAWLEEYCCKPSDEAHSFFTYDLIAGIEEENVLCPLNKTKYDLFVGVDIGRRKDLTVIWVWERVARNFFARLVEPLEKTPFRVQREVLWEILKHPKVRRCCMDSTGLGMQLAEETQEQFGQYRVEAVNFSSRVKEEMAYPLRAAAEDKLIKIPADRKIREDFHSLRKVTTAAANTRFDVDATAATHADYFWAAALGYYAAGEKLVDFQARTAGRRQTQRIARDYGKINYGGYHR